MTDLPERAPSPAGRASGYYYRRPLGAQELMPAIGAGVGAAIVTGLAVFYFARLFLQRTPLLTEQPLRTGRPTSRRTT